MPTRTEIQIVNDTLKFNKNCYKDIQNISLIQADGLSPQEVGEITLRTQKAYIIDFVLESPYSTAAQKSFALDLAAEIGYLTPVRDGYWVSGYSTVGYI